MVASGVRMLWIRRSRRESAAWTVVVSIVRSLRSPVELSIYPIQGLSKLFETPTHQDASRCAAEHVVVRQLAEEVDALGRGFGSLAGCEGGVAQGYRLVGLQGQWPGGRQHPRHLRGLAGREGRRESQ